MDVLISNNASAPTSQKVKDTLFMYCIKSGTSEPRIIKTMLSTVLGISKMSQIVYSPSPVPQ